MTAIKLVVKAPNQKLEDQTFACSLDWTVLRLKSFLSLSYPSKPAIEEQRLIYSGHLLKDDQALRDVFTQSEGEENHTFTVHLVCAQRQTDVPPVRKVTASAPSGTEQANVQPNLANQNVQVDGNNTANYAQPLFPGFPGNTFNLANYGNMAPAMFSPEMIQQMAMMQQVYAQYYAQLIARAGATAAGQVPFSPVLPIIASRVPMSANAPPAQVAAEVATMPLAPQPPRNEPRREVQPQVPRMNAGPGRAVEDDDVNERDWLDKFYWISRATMLFAVLYFYSSLSRFLIVILLSVLFYIYHKFQRPERPQQERPRMNEPVAGEPDNENNDGNRNQDASESGTSSDDNSQENSDNDDDLADAREFQEMIAGNADNRADASRRPNDESFSRLRFCWVFVSSLFSSLIPEPPTPVN